MMRKRIQIMDDRIQNTPLSRRNPSQKPFQIPNSKFYIPDPRGFTLVELLIAMAVFASMLLICSYGLIQITRVYYKAARSSKTQETARSITDDISQNIQLSVQSPFLTPPGPTISTNYTPEGGGPTVIVNSKFFCIGRTRYTYYSPLIFLGRQSGHVMWRDQITSDTCSTGPANLNAADPSAGTDVSGGNATDGRELLSPDMEVAALSISSAGGSIYSVNVTIAAAAGDADLAGSGPTVSCRAGSGSQFCAVSNLTTFVQRRL